MPATLSHIPIDNEKLLVDFELFFIIWILLKKLVSKVILNSDILYIEQAAKWNKVRDTMMQALETSSLLTEEYSIKVLVALMGLPKSVNELSEKLGIPIAACYRRIRSLEKAGLLYCVDRGLTQKGKRVCLYKARIRNGMIILEKNKVRVRLDMIDGSIENLDYDAMAPQNQPVAKVEDHPASG